MPFLEHADNNQSSAVLDMCVMMCVSSSMCGPVFMPSLPLCPSRRKCCPGVCADLIGVTGDAAVRADH